MKLTLKLGVVLSSLITLLLSATLRFSYRAEFDRLRRSQDSALAAVVQRIARHCEAAWDNHSDDQFEETCRRGLRLLAETDVPGAFFHAALVDSAGRVLIQDTGAEADPPGPGASSPYLRMAAAGSRPQVRTFHLQVPGDIRAFSSPISHGPEGPAALVVAFREQALRDDLTWLSREVRGELLQACLGAVAVGVLCAAALVGYFLAPLRALADGARKVTAGDLEHRIPERHGDELGLVAVEFNRMTGRLRELEGLRETFLAQITHDIKNPLNAMMSTMDVLLNGYRGTLTAGQIESVRTLIDNSRFLCELADNLREVTRLEAGQLKVAPVHLELASEVDSVLQLLEAQAQKFEVSLKADLSPEPERVFADPAAFRRVLTNLVSNALKFTPSGGSVTVRASLACSGEVVVSVADTGVGIPENRLSALFAKFSQVPETRNKVRESPGTGLGLFICKTLVEAHGGTIGVKSTLFKGAEFECRFPPAPAAGALAASAARTAAA